MDVSIADITPEEYKGHAALANVPDTGTLVKNYVNAQELIGKKTLPTDADSQDKWDETHEKLGWKKDRAEYKVDLGDEYKEAGAIKDKIIDVFHKNRLTMKQAGEAAKGVLAELKNSTSANADQIAKANQEIDAKVKGLFGDNKEQIMGRVDGVLDKFIPADLKDDFKNMDASTKSAFSLVVDGFMKEYGGEDYLAGKSFRVSEGLSIGNLMDKRKAITTELKTLKPGTDEYNRKSLEYFDLQKSIDSTTKK